jgi:hypothetical protein
MAGWFPLPELLNYELIEAREEGRETTGLDEQVQTAIASGNEAQINKVYDLLMAAPFRPDYPFDERSDLEAIRARSPKTQTHLQDSNSPADWKDKFFGAWLGRCCGCALGKPLEMQPFTTGRDGKPGWQFIHDWFNAAKSFPIRGYTPGSSPFGENISLAVLRDPKSHRENIQFMETDDDIRYTVMGLLLLEQKGRDWNTWDVGKHWHNSLTYGQVCTAETQAYLNFAQVTCNTEGKYFPRPADWQSRLEWVRTHRNPFREWIGAQIRADGFAYGAAGDPTLAAEFAWRDASFSHVRNGIYGEMFIAAMIAAAFVESDNNKLIEIGLGVIPGNCRLANDVKKAVEIASSCTKQLELVERIWDAFSHYDPFHTNNNAALVAAALLYSGDNFEKGVTTAVLGGWDTDCNGATIGSILGAKLGAANIPVYWKLPLNDMLYAEIPGFHPIHISECALRSEAVWQNLKNTR